MIGLNISVQHCSDANQLCGMAMVTSTNHLEQEHTADQQQSASTCVHVLSVSVTVHACIYMYLLISECVSDYCA